MVNVVVTGGAGFLGSRLARELLAARSLDVAGRGARPLRRVSLVDRVPVPRISPPTSGWRRSVAISANCSTPLAQGGTHWPRPT